LFILRTAAAERRVEPRQQPAGFFSYNALNNTFLNAAAASLMVAAPAALFARQIGG
jgi:hypothetical protein